MLWIHGLTVVLIVQGRGKWRFCLKLLQDCYIIVLWIHGMTVVLLVRGGGEMAFLLAVTAVLIHHSVIDTWTVYNVVSTG